MHFTMSNSNNYTFFWTKAASGIVSCVNKMIKFYVHRRLEISSPLAQCLPPSLFNSVGCQVIEFLLHCVNWFDNDDHA